MLLKPVDFGALGNGINDDSIAINKMFDFAMGYLEQAYIDLSGTWYIGSTIQFRAPPQTNIIAGNFNVLDNVNLDVGLFINLRSFCNVKGIIRVSGKKTSHFHNRNLINGIHLHSANGCVFDGFHVQYVKMNGILNGVNYGSNIIGASLGTIIGLNCGYPSSENIPLHLKLSAKTTKIERFGFANSTAQRAKIYLDNQLPLNKGDYIVINGQIKNGGFICEVIESNLDNILTYPWPGNLQGDVSVDVIPMIGSAISLNGNNTTQVSINNLIAQYCGHAAQINSLYGCRLNSVIGEMVGSTVTLGKFNTSINGAIIHGLHSELSTTDILLGGLSINKCTLMGNNEIIIPGINGYHVKPTLLNGSPSTYNWPLIIY